LEKIKAKVGDIVPPAAQMQMNSSLGVPAATQQKPAEK